MVNRTNFFIFGQGNPYHQPTILEFSNSRINLGDFVRTFGLIIFWDFDVYYDEIGALLCQNEAEKNNSNIKPIFKWYYAILPTNAMII